jgi:tetratricopeptide (TPR) repeat protein
VERGLLISKHNQHAYLALAWLNLLERNREAAVEYLEKADAINPNSSYFSANISTCFGFLGEFEKSNALLERAIRLHPLPAWWTNIPSIMMALKNHEFEKMLFHASKITVGSVVYYQLFDMIALYYLEDRKALKAMLKQYRKRYPQGLAFATRMLSVMVLDDLLRDQIVTALQAIEEMA